MDAVAAALERVAEAVRIDRQITTSPEIVARIAALEIENAKLRQDVNSLRGKLYRQEAKAEERGAALVGYADPVRAF